MIKESILKNISSAKEEHIHWVKQANNLNFGSFEDNKKQINDVVSHFGQWLYTEGSKLSISPSTQHLIKRVESHNNTLNELYIDIYKIFFVIPTKRNILYKIATLNSKNITSFEKQEIVTKLKHLNLYSSQIINTLDIIEDRVKSLSNNEIKKIC
ncbi:MAG: hypothetical protein QM493_06495 [Sulfurovum sp.]